MFSHPEKKGNRLPVVPVFIPFAGCGVRCVFCAQTAQTGQPEGQLTGVLADFEKTMQHRLQFDGAPVEVAFYGGTFTALPHEDLLRCLQTAQVWRERGIVGGIRCSTRPDCIDDAVMDILCEYGVELVELGVQSFSNNALSVSKRNYTVDAIYDACRCIRRHGLQYGIQLMPGLPGASLEDSYRDVGLTLELIPSCVRLYPCLVFAHTPLAQMWQNGLYTPFELDETVQLLAHACLCFWGHGVPVIRMGVAPEPSAMSSLLAGPFHRSLGSMARGTALHAYITEMIANHYGNQPPPSLVLSVPQKYQGELWGFRGALKDAYARLGIRDVVFHDERYFTIDETGFIGA